MANDIVIKNDNTVIIMFDDFAINTTYPLKSNNQKELTVILKNGSKIKHLLSIRKNGKIKNFINLPSQESHTETILLKNGDDLILRPLYPPAEDIKLQQVLKN
jgi:hypothetical protein